MQYFETGTTPRLSTTWRDPDDVLTDADGDVTLTVYLSGVAAYGPYTTTKTSTGVYEYWFPVPAEAEVGVYVFEWTGLFSTKAQAGRFRHHIVNNAK